MRPALLNDLSPITVNVAMSVQERLILQVGNTRIHAVSQGQGPLVLLVHGFPESWYSWRHQLEFLAGAGYHAVAIDQRGYGASSKFWDPLAYRIDRLVADVAGVVAALGETSAVIVGHDWGAPVAWTAGWLHPEIFRGVVGLSVPFSGRALVALPGSPFGERRPSELHRELAGPGQDFYQDYFGSLTPPIAEIESNLRGWLRSILWSFSAEGMIAAGLPPLIALPQIDVIRGSALTIPHGTRMRERMDASDRLPAWLDGNDLAFYVAELERSGLAGPLSYYRCMEAGWEALAHCQGRVFTPPSLFIGGDYDVATAWGAEALARTGECMLNHRGTHILSGCGHWVQQEHPEQTNALLLDFLRRL